MAERLFSSQTPTNDDSDPGTAHTYGNKFSSSAAGTVATARIWCPNPKPPTLWWLLFKASDQSLLTSLDCSALTLTAGAWNTIDPGDVSLSASTDYVVAAHYAGGHHVFTTTGVTFPWGNGNHLTVLASLFKNSGGNTDYPTSSFDLYAFADIEFTPSGATVTGTGSGPLGALTGSATGTPTVLGVAAGPVGALTGSATGLVTVLGTASASVGALVGLAFGDQDTRASSTSTVAAGRTSTDSVSAGRTSTPTVTGG